MQRTLVFAALLATATPALAEVPMSGPEFETYTDGRTIYYNQNGRPYGVEEYLPNNRVRWSFLDGQCKEGYWYEQGDLICFIYEGQANAPQCWTFWEEPGGIRALFEDTPGATELFEASNANEPMLCLGPEVGV